MKKKIILLLITMMVTFVALFCSTFAYLTMGDVRQYTWEMGNVDVDVTVTGAVDVAPLLTVNELAYIELTNDFQDDTYTVLDEMAVVITIRIESNNVFDVRPLVKLPSIADTPGLLYVVVTDATVTSFLNYVDLTGLTTEAAIRDAIDTHNHDRLEEFYESGDGMTDGDALEFRIVFWGDYNALPASEQATYLSKTFTFDLVIAGMQDVDDYGGTPDYDTDGVI